MRLKLLILVRAMAAVLDHFTDRLKAGARADLLALAKVTFIKSRTARVFYDNGFKTVASLANADPKELVPILMQVGLVHKFTDMS
jgi:DNA polymerase theta